MIAECIAGRPDRAFEYYRKISPAYLEDIQELHRMEPYVYSQMIAGKAAPRHGEAKNSWLTGTAAWNFIAVTQWILGVRAEFDGLRIEPCLPKKLRTVEITRLFRGCRYRISIRNTGRAPRGSESQRGRRGNPDTRGSAGSSGLRDPRGRGGLRRVRQGHCAP